MKNFTNRLLITTAAITLLAGCYSDSSIDDEAYTDPNTDSNESVSDEYAANVKTDDIMLEYYLYNEEYSEATRDLTLDYETMFYNAILATQGNDLDKKPLNEEATSYTVYSYITRTESTKTKAAEAVNSFGFVALDYGWTLNNGAYELILTVNGVYNNSPASNASITRGYAISQINGVSISTLYALNSTLISSLLSPTSGQEVELTLYGSNEVITLTAEYINECPVLYALEIAEDVGYFNLVSFDYNYSSDILMALKTLKDSGVSKAIVDLRLNPGGHIIASNLLCTALCNSSSNDIFCYYRFNQDLTDKPTQTASNFILDYDSSNGLFYDHFLSSVSDSYKLDLDHVYFLVSGSTASASEITINTLKGTDIGVTLIGSQTVGKNVGSQAISFTSGDYTYEVTPVMFELYNSNGDGDYYNGFEVDEEVDEYYLFNDFCSEEPLIAKALELAGVTTQTTPTMRSCATTNNISPTGETLTNPNTKRGAILLREN